jgi:hypothetical protein
MSVDYRFVNRFKASPQRLAAARRLLPEHWRTDPRPEARIINEHWARVIAQETRVEAVAGGRPRSGLDARNGRD